MKLDEIPVDHPAWKVVEPIVWTRRGLEPGELVRVRYRDGRKETLLVGDINGLGGQCDDCPIERDAVVIAQLDLDDLLKDVK